MTLRLLPLVTLLSLTGCFYHRTTVVNPPPKSKKSKSTPECHPSQYWDGEQCRHKGKGKGARKHDG